MNCFLCVGETDVIDSRKTNKNIIRRRRVCTSCGHRFSTHETVINPGSRKPMTAEERRALNKTYQLRRGAKLEAQKTGKPVEQIYVLWGINLETQI
jgi:transcriptional regulator NrdR family protein